MRTSIVGTTIACVTAWVRTRPSQSAALKWSRYTIRRPAYRVGQQVATAAMWDAGTLTMVASLCSADRELDGAEDVGRQVPVPQYRALRGGGRPARHQQHGDRVGSGSAGSVS